VLEALTVAANARKAQDIRRELAIDERPTPNRRTISPLVACSPDLDIRRN
jgi:hypothetical protein